MGYEEDSSRASSYICGVLTGTEAKVFEPPHSSS